MRLLLLVAFGAVALGIYFYDDIDRYIANETSGTGADYSVTKSVGNLGDSLSNNMRSIGSSLGN